MEKEDEKQILIIRSRLGDTYFKLINTVRDRKVKHEPIRSLECQIGIINRQLQRLGGVLTADEKQRLAEMR